MAELSWASAFGPVSEPRISHAVIPQDLFGPFNRCSLLVGHFIEFGLMVFHLRGLVLRENVIRYLGPSAGILALDIKQCHPNFLPFGPRASTAAIFQAKRKAS